MSIEMSRRNFIIAAGIATAGLVLPESEGLDRVANPNDRRMLREFLDQTLEGVDVTRPSTANLLTYLGRAKPSEVRFAHNANSLGKIDAFILDEDRDIAELDVRIDPEGPYVSHSKGRKSDIDPMTVYDMVALATLPKALKYDFKEAEAIGAVIESFEDPDRPRILNADVFHNARFGITPDEFVEQSEGLSNALLSIGRKGDFGNMADFVHQFIELAERYPDRDFILPAHLVDVLGSFEELKTVQEVPNAFLMVYRTGNFTLTKRHIKLIKEKFDPVKHPGLLQDTYFDL